MSPKFMEYRKLSAKDFLAKLEAEEGFDVSPPIDVERIVELIGAELDHSVDRDNLNIAGSVTFHKNKARIWVNPLESEYEPRKRFTIAHEIGHLVLHIESGVGEQEFKDTVKMLTRKRSFWDSREYEANNFAAQLLMPVALLEEHGNSILKRNNEKHGERSMTVKAFIIAMADRFEVSETAMKYRLKNLGSIK